MRKTIYICLFLLSSFAITSCEDEIAETKDINYISFEGKATSVVVEKNSTANLDIKVFTTKISGKDREFNINVISSSSTADPASYNVPQKVTVPANSNMASFTVGISDVNIGNNGVKLVLGFEPKEGLFTGDNITVSIKKLCQLNINDFLGNYIITEAGYGSYATTITLDPVVANRIWITNFWDFSIDLAYYDFDPVNGTVTMPSQELTMGNGNDYTSLGSGTYDACAGTFHMEYQGDVAGTIHDFAPAE